MTNSLEITGLVLTSIVSRFLSACLFYENIAQLTSKHKRVRIATGSDERCVKKKKFTLEQATKAQKGVEVQLYAFFNLNARRVGSQHRASAGLPVGMSRYSLYCRMGGPQERLGRVRKISPQPGFDPLAVQPVTSRRND